MKNKNQETCEYSVNLSEEDFYRETKASDWRAITRSIYSRRKVEQSLSRKKKKFSSRRFPETGVLFFFSGLILKSTGKVNKQWRNVTNRTKSGSG